MKSLKKIALIGCLFFFGCEGGFLNSGLESEKFFSLAEKMNNDVRLKQSTIESIQSGTRFVDFQIISIKKIDPSDTQGASIVFSEFSIDDYFDKTEIIVVDARFEDDNGNLFVRPITYLFGTKDNYYSESEFPLDKLFRATEFSQSAQFQNAVFIDYFNGNLRIRKLFSDQLFSRIVNVISFSFSGVTFDVNIFNEGESGRTVGSGYISGEKMAQFPRR